MKFDWNVYEYDYFKRVRNLENKAQGKVKSDKFFPVFLEDKKEIVFKPLSKAKPLCTPYFAYSEVFWSTIIHQYFDKDTPVYRLAICKNIDTDFPNKHHHGVVVNSLVKGNEKLVNLYEIFRDHPDPSVDIQDYTNRCCRFYDYQAILESKFIKENKEIGNELAKQLLYSILRIDQNYHYENISFIEENGQIKKVAPAIDHEFSTMFLYLDNILMNLDYFQKALKKLTDNPFKHQNDIFGLLRYEAFAILSRNLDKIIENYRETSFDFLEKLKVFLHDLEKEPICLEDYHYITPFNSDNYKIGILRYKENKEKDAIKKQEEIPQYSPKIEDVSKLVYNEVLTSSTVLKSEMEKRLRKTKE